MPKSLRSTRAEYSAALDWLEFAQKLAENGRAGIARERRRLKEILAPEDHEDSETLAAVDEGIRDADAGRVVPAEKVRELIPAWIAASSPQGSLNHPTGAIRCIDEN